MTSSASSDPEIRASKLADVGVADWVNLSPSRQHRTAFLVSGMHRSGTSALARTLSLLGGTLPEDLVPPNAGNPRGHWEPSVMVDLNDRMLADAGSDLYSVVDIDPAWFGSAAAMRFTEAAIDLASRSFSGDLVVLKDPRTALLAPVWNKALEANGYRVAHILPLRRPADVAASLRRRHLQDFPYDAWASPRGEAVWLRYTLAALRGAKGSPCVFVSYSDLLSDWRGVAERIGSEIGMSWPREQAEAEAEIAGFLHANSRADTTAAIVPDGAPVQAGITSLADSLYRDLCVSDVSHADAIDAEFSERVAGMRDLILSFENLYPLVWQQFKGGEDARERLTAASMAEADLRTNVQRTWAALTQANSDKLALQQTVASHQAQIGSIEADRVRQDALIAASDERARTAEGARLLLEAELQEVRLNAAQAEARVSAMEASTSWRLTAPLRAFSRALLRRS